MSDIDTRLTFADATARPARPDRRKEEERRREAADEADALRETEDFIAGVEEDLDRFRQRSERSNDLALLDTLDDLATSAADKRDHHIRRAQLEPVGSAERAKFQEQARQAHSRAKQWREMETELRSTVRVTEPSPYGPYSPFSWIADMAVVASPASGTDKAEAEERLRRHAKDVGMAAVGGTLRARKALRDATRKDEFLRMASEHEYRAMTSGSTSGGAFVTPEYLLDQWARWRSYVPAVSDACGSADLPEYGLEVNVPAVTSGATVEALTTENSAVSQTTFTTTYRKAAIATYAGSAKISQQLLDRSGPGLSFDAVVYAQLRESLTQQVSAAVAQAMVAAATTTVTRTGSTVATVPDLWADVAKAALSLEDTAGTLLFATHTFLPPAWYRYGASSVDSQNRPIWTPDVGCRPNPTTGYTGYSIAGSDVFTDGATPQNASHSGNAQMIVANPAKGVLVLRGEPICQVFPEPYAEDLSVLVRMYQYVAVVVRHASAAAVVTSTDGAYTTTPTV